MNFEAYLISKKIDGEAFLQREPDVWKAWNEEFEQLHPNSFTAQKLYLINPIRRKYPLKVVELAKPAPVAEPLPAGPAVAIPPVVATPPPVAKPAVPRPVFKQKPKTT